MAQKLRPVIRYAKTSLGIELPEEKRYLPLYHCPVCDKRLVAKDVNPRLYDASKRCRNGEPSYCKYCGSLIYPIEI